MALFLDTADFKKHLPEMHRNFNWKNDLEVKVNQYTRMHVLPFISEAQYTPLEARYLAGNTTPQDDFLLPFLQPAIAHYTYIHLLTSYRVNLSQMGVQESRSADDGSSSPANFFAINDAKTEAANTADFFMEQLLAFMEANKADYPGWAASEAYTEIKSCFIFNTAQLNQYVKASNSRRTFLAMKSELLWIQENRIRPDLGETFYDQLLSQVKDNSLTAANEKVVKLVRAFLAKSAMVMAIPNHQVEYLHGGILVKTYLDESPRKLAANADAVSSLIESFSRQATEARANLLSFLNDNATDYPDYTPSAYNLSDSEISYGPLNNECKKSFRV